MLHFCTISSLDMKALPVTISWLWSSCIICLYIYSQIPLQGEHEKINCENYYDECKEIISSRYRPNYS